MQRNLILHNGNIYTMDESSPQVAALWIHGDTIELAGTDVEVMSAAPKGSEIIDLRGATAVPGLTDCHTHFGMFALSLQGVDFVGADSLAESLNRVAAKAKTLSPGSWLLGQGWNPNVWPEGRTPTRHDLDSVVASHPAAFTSKDCHSIWVNSLALEKAGISEQTPDPEDGCISREPGTGKPIGLLCENAQKLIFSVIPEKTTDEVAEAIQQAVKVAHRAGVTGVHRMAAFDESLQEFHAFQCLMRGGKLALRVYTAIPPWALDWAVAIGLQTGFGNKFLRIGPLKLFADGALGSRTAAMYEPYDDDGSNLGIIITGRDDLSQAVQKAAAAGIAVSIHAIGDRAVANAISALESAQSVASQHGLRQRMEHVQLIQAEDIGRLARTGTIASVQPVHATSDMYMVDKAWGARGKGAYVFRDLIDAGVRVAFGSDCPVEELNPLKGMYAAVTRRRENGDPPGGWHPEQKITAREALAAYTTGAAYLSGEESIKGSLTSGKLGDVAVLSEDILRCAPEDILKTKVLYTILGGEVVYKG